jgi:serine/threonine-protein kinase SRPK3
MKLDNFQTMIPDPEDEYLDAFCAEETVSPSVSKRTDSGMPIVSTRQMKQTQLTHVIMCDLGSAVHVDEGYPAVVQALPYRAPEVMLGADWDQKIDIWSLGVLVSANTAQRDLELINTGLGVDI